MLNNIEQGVIATGEALRQANPAPISGVLDRLAELTGDASAASSQAARLSSLAVLANMDLLEAYFNAKGGSDAAAATFRGVAGEWGAARTVNGSLAGFSEAVAACHDPMLEISDQLRQFREHLGAAAEIGRTIMESIGAEGQLVVAAQESRVTATASLAGYCEAVGIEPPAL